MLRRSLFSPALAVVSGLLATGFPAVAGAAPAGAERPPAYDPGLEVTIDGLSPSYLPESGVVRVSGSVTNVDDVPWVGVNVYALLDDEPMVSAGELAEAVEADPELVVGDRITAEGSYDSIGDLEPGQSARFFLSVSRELLPPTEAGVYWFGVHALGGSSETPDDAVADGRARTFLPAVPRETPGRVKTAVVIPLRHYLPYNDDGSLARLDHWQRTLSPGGRLRGLVDFATAAGSAPVTWLVDPAVPDAIRRVGRGNPPRSIAPTDPLPEGEPTDAPTAPGSPPADQGSGDEGSGDEGSGDEGSADQGSGGAADDVTQDPGDGEGSAAPEGPEGAEGPLAEGRQLTEEELAASEAAVTWLGLAREVVQRGEVLGLPFGDLDVAAAAELDPELYDATRDRPSAVLADWGVTPRPVLMSPTGYLNAAGFDLAPDDTTILATDRMFGEDPPGVAEIDGSTVGVVSSGAIGGGPGPGDRFTTLQLRQRILSEAAIRLITPGRHPLVVPMPIDWKPSNGSTFFSGLDVDWVDLTTVADAIDRRGNRTPASELDYPAVQQRRQLDPPAFAAVDDLIEAGNVLQNLLTRNSQVAAAVTDQALAGASYGSRGVQVEARNSLLDSIDSVEGQLAAVTIAAGPGVTLSGRSGGFAAVITNGLDQPVTVNVVGRSNGGVDISPIEPVQLGAKSRATVVLEARANRVGVTNVTLELTDLEGNPLGPRDQLPIRSAQVSVVIWLIIGTGLALLFLAIVVRLVRRIRGAATHPKPADAPADPATEDPPVAAPAEVPR